MPRNPIMKNYKNIIIGILIIGLMANLIYLVSAPPPKMGGAGSQISRASDTAGNTILSNPAQIHKIEGGSDDGFSGDWHPYLYLNIESYLKRYNFKRGDAIEISYCIKSHGGTINLELNIPKEFANPRFTNEELKYKSIIDNKYELVLTNEEQPVYNLTYIALIPIDMKLKGNSSKINVDAGIKLESSVSEYHPAASIITIYNNKPP